MYRNSLLLLVISLMALLPTPALSQNSENVSPSKMAETGEYLQAIEKAKDQPIEGQVEIWRRYLQDHFETAYRSEIEANLSNLERLLDETNPKRKKEKRDTDRYLKAVEFSKRLKPGDQILLWEQFLEENPDTIYRQEAEATLDALKAKHGKKRRPQPSRTKNKYAPTEKITLAPELDFKSAKKAMLLAAGPGLIVPGIAHWYVGEYLPAGMLTAIRVGALGAGIPGIIKRNNPMIIAGSILYGLSYFIDFADAPFAVQRYNDYLEAESKSKVNLHPYFPRDQRIAAVTFSFSF